MIEPFDDIGIVAQAAVVRTGTGFSFQRNNKNEFVKSPLAYLNDDRTKSSDRPRGGRCFLSSPLPGEIMADDNGTDDTVIGIRF